MVTRRWTRCLLRKATDEDTLSQMIYSEDDVASLHILIFVLFIGASLEHENRAESNMTGMKAIFLSQPRTPSLHRKVS